jgi:TM2 domain-containing membrane protein YozV
MTILIIPVILLFIGWLSYEIYNAPLMDDDGNIINDKNNNHDNN